MAAKHSQAILNKKLRATQCAYCERPFVPGLNNISEKSIDHFYPLSRGGTNANSNKIICCQDCNHLKGNLLPNEFFYRVACHIRWNEPLQGKVTYPVDKLKVIYRNLKVMLAGRPLAVYMTAPPKAAPVRTVAVQKVYAPRLTAGGPVLLEDGYVPDRRPHQCFHY